MQCSLRAASYMYASYDRVTYVHALLAPSINPLCILLQWSIAQGNITSQGYAALATRRASLLHCPLVKLVTSFLSVLFRVRLSDSCNLADPITVVMQRS